MSENKGNKILLYYNAYSGSGVFKNNLDYIVERCQEKGFQVLPVRASKGYIIDQMLGEIDPNDFDRIIAAGGDGTINICVNAMVRHDINLPLGLLPAGTANDFAYYFDIPSSIEYQLDIALGDVTSNADVGVVNNKNFMVVMNGESAGGFRKLSPQSSINDGKLDVIAFRKMPIVELGPLLFEVVKGSHPNNKNVVYFQTDKLKIESPVDISTDIDGEHGEKLPLEFSVLHNRLQIFVSEDSVRYGKE